MLTRSKVKRTNAAFILLKNKTSSDGYHLQLPNTKEKINVPREYVFERVFPKAATFPF